MSKMSRELVDLIFYWRIALLTFKFAYDRICHVFFFFFKNLNKLFKFFQKFSPTSTLTLCVGYQHCLVVTYSHAARIIFTQTLMRATVKTSFIWVNTMLSEISFPPLLSFSLISFKQHTFTKLLCMVCTHTHTHLYFHSHN